MIKAIRENESEFTGLAESLSRSPEITSSVRALQNVLGADTMVYTALIQRNSETPTALVFNSVQSPQQWPDRLTRYTLHESPCEAVAVEGRWCVFPNVKERFPNDIGLQRFAGGKVQDYMGAVVSVNKDYQVLFAVLLQRNITPEDMFYFRWHTGAATVTAAEQVMMRLAETPTQAEAEHILERALLFALAERDIETVQHNLIVGQFAYRISRQLGLSEDRCTRLERAARLHDIGKIAIPDSVLKKNGSLEPDEWLTMQSHVQRATEILRKSLYLNRYARIVSEHHQRYDGQGYPVVKISEKEFRPLRGDEISIEGQILAIADHVSALAEDRPYRKAWSVEQIRAELFQNKGKRFSPELVENVLLLIDDSQTDNLSLLYNGVGIPHDQDDILFKVVSKHAGRDPQKTIPLHR